MRESTIEAYLRERVKALGGVALKLSPAGFAGLPDRLVLLPKARLWFVELKAPGEAPRPLQVSRHRLLRGLGFQVLVIDSIQGVDDAFPR